jgi:hypothetical protein
MTTRMRSLSSYLVFVLVSFFSLSCAHRQTSVLIKEGNPQQFIISGNGVLEYFEITGPTRRCEQAWKEDRLPSMEVYWRIEPAQEFNVNRFSGDGPITYGKVPVGFRQVSPVEGAPLPICEGGPYNVTLGIRDGGGVCMFFAVYEAGRIVSEADDDQ